MKKPGKEHKEGKITTKWFQITGADYRGMLALVLVSGWVLSLFLNQQASAVLGPSAGTAIGWYFEGRSRA